MSRKFNSITVKQKDNLKLYKKLYYQIAVKPHLKPKGRAGVMKIRCPLCSTFADYKRFLEKDPYSRIGIKMFWFGGRANIQIQDFTKIEPQIEQNIKDNITHKLKLLQIAFKEELEPLQKVDVIEEIVITRPLQPLELQMRELIPVSINEEVSL